MNAKLYLRRSVESQSECCQVSETDAKPKGRAPSPILETRTSNPGEPKLWEQGVQIPQRNH